MPSLNPKAVLTDGSAALGNAIQTVFPNAEHLLCVLHLQWNLQDNLNRKGVDKEIVARLVRDFWECQRQTGESSADLRWTTLKASIIEFGIPEFAARLEETKRKWLACFRTKLPLQGYQSNQTAEAEFSKLKQRGLNRWSTPTALATELHRDQLKTFEQLQRWSQFQVGKFIKPFVEPGIKAFLSHASEFLIESAMSSTLENFLLATQTLRGTVCTDSTIVVSVKNGATPEATVRFNSGSFGVACSCYFQAQYLMPCAHIFCAWTLEQFPLHVRLYDTFHFKVPSVSTVPRDPSRSVLGFWPNEEASRETLYVDDAYETNTQFDDGGVDDAAAAQQPTVRSSMPPTSQVAWQLGSLNAIGRHMELTTLNLSRQSSRRAGMFLNGTANLIRDFQIKLKELTEACKRAASRHPSMVFASSVGLQTLARQASEGGKKRKRNYKAEAVARAMLGYGESTSRTRFLKPTRASRGPHGQYLRRIQAARAATHKVGEAETWKRSQQSRMSTAEPIQVRKSPSHRSKSSGEGTSPHADTMQRAKRVKWTPLELKSPIIKVGTAEIDAETILPQKLTMSPNAKRGKGSTPLAFASNASIDRNTILTASSSVLKL